MNMQKLDMKVQKYSYMNYSHYKLYCTFTSLPNICIHNASLKQENCQYTCHSTIWKMIKRIASEFSYVGGTHYVCKTLLLLLKLK